MNRYYTCYVTWHECSKTQIRCHANSVNRKHPALLLTLVGSQKNCCKIPKGKPQTKVSELCRWDAYCVSLHG